MEKKRLSLLSRFMEVTAKSTKNKTVKKRVNLGSAMGVEAVSRGERHCCFPPKFFSPCFAPNTCMTYVEFFFFKFLSKEQKERKTWWEHKIESRVAETHTAHWCAQPLQLGRTFGSELCGSSWKRNSGQLIHNAHDESKVIPRI